MASKSVGGSRIIRAAIGGFAITVLSNACFFVAHLLIPRALTREAYAQFTVALSFVVLCSLLADLGLLHMHTRVFAECMEEYSQGLRDRRGVLLGSVLALRIFLACLVCLVVLLVAPMMYDREMVTAMVILSLSLFLSSRILIVRAAGESLLRGRGMYYVASIFVLLDAVTLVMVLLTMGKPSLHSVAWAYSLSGIPGFTGLVIYVGYWVRKEGIRLRVDVSAIRSMLRTALPLSFGTTFFVIFNETDKLLLDKLSNPIEVSNFGAVIRISTGLSIFPIVFGAILAPEVTRLLVRHDHDRAKHITGLAMRVLLVISVGIALTLTVLSEQVATLGLGHNYITAAPALMWLGWYLIAFFVGSFFSELTIAAGHFRISMAFAAIIMVFTIAADVVLIPRWGAVGAAASRLLGVGAGVTYLLRAHIESSFMDVIRLKRDIVRIMLIAGVFGILLVTVHERLSPSYAWLWAAIDLVIYSLAILFSKLLTISDLRLMWDRVKRRSDPSMAQV